VTFVAAFDNPLPSASERIPEDRRIGRRFPVFGKGHSRNSPIKWLNDPSMRRTDIPARYIAISAPWTDPKVCKMPVKVLDPKAA
jgi:hypothetical protein